MISKTGIHALKSLAVLAGLPENEFIGATAIADKITAPQNYLGKILGILAREGLLVSQKGKGGGVRLARDPSTISLYEVLDLIDNVSDWEGCFLGSDKCSGSNACEVHRKWEPVRDTYLEFLKTTTITDIREKTVRLD